ncbi:MAG TPA: hypothetical protein VI138_08590 [Candidatus Dormibacteraeota bacterium]
MGGSDFLLSPPVSDFAAAGAGAAAASWPLEPAGAIEPELDDLESFL